VERCARRDAAVALLIALRAAQRDVRALTRDGDVAETEADQLGSAEGAREAEENVGAVAQPDRRPRAAAARR
jgi:hypothetical protein